MKNDEFYTTNNPKSFKDQLFDMLKKSPNNLIKKDFKKEKIVNFRYLLECVVETDLENEKINFIDCLKEKIFWHTNGIEIVEEIKLCDHCHATNQNLLYKIQKMEKMIKEIEFKKNQSINFDSWENDGNGGIYSKINKLNYVQAKHFVSILNNFIKKIDKDYEVIKKDT